MINISEDYLSCNLIEKYVNRMVKNLYFLTEKYLDNIPEGYSSFEIILPAILSDILIINDKVYLVFDSKGLKYYINYNIYESSWSEKYRKDASMYIEFDNEKTLWFTDNNINRIIFTDKVDNYNPGGPTYILCDDFTLDQFKKICKHAKDLYIGEMLMSEKHLLGVKNILKCECLAYAKLSPNRIVDTLKDDRIEKLYEAIQVISRLLFNDEIKLREYKYLVYKVKGAQKDKFKDKFLTYWFPEKQF